MRCKVSREFICKGCGEKFNKEMQSGNIGYCYICNEFYTKKYVSNLEARIDCLKNGIIDDETLKTLIKEHQMYKDLEAKLKEQEIDVELLEEKIDGMQQDINWQENELEEKKKENLKLKRIVDGIDKLKQYDAKIENFVLLNPDYVYADGNYLVIKTINQDKIKFAIGQLTEIREYVIDCWTLDELEGKVRLDIAKKIRLKIEELKKEMK